MNYLKLEIEINELPQAVKQLDSSMLLEARYKDDTECIIEVSVLGASDDEYSRTLLLSYLMRLAKSTNSNIEVL